MVRVLHDMKIENPGTNSQNQAPIQNNFLARKKQDTDETMPNRKRRNDCFKLQSDVSEQIKSLRVDLICIDFIV